jgi:hypothetical protein
MFDDDNGVAVITQAMQYAQKLFDILEMQAGSGFIEDVERLPGVAFAELLG